MIEVKNQFANHLIFWSFALPLVAVLVLPALMTPDTFAITNAELAFFREVLDKDTVAITASTDATFNGFFVQTHIAEYVRDFLAPKTNFTGSEIKLGLFARNASSSYNNALWLMLYRGIWRITGLWTTVLAVILALGVPCLVDGLAVRAKKAYNFQFHNPVFFWSASHSLIMVVGLGIFLPFLPYSLNPSIMAGFFTIFCMSLWIAATNFQTGN